MSVSFSEEDENEALRGSHISSAHEHGALADALLDKGPLLGRDGGVVSRALV